MGGDSVASDIRTARKDSNIKAIILRVDSGGGSVVGSEVIRREVELANKVKPVVVSMSDVAASGGYWIATPARKIVADPDTITGSIGVLIGKFNVSGLYNLLGISTDSIATSDNATLFSEQQNFSPAQRAYIEKSLQETYADFTKGVAAGRKMTVEAVDKIGKGRVWSGAQAKELGLVDELGGLDRAIEVAKDLAHIPCERICPHRTLPSRKNFLAADPRTREGPAQRISNPSNPSCTTSSARWNRSRPAYHTSSTSADQAAPRPRAASPPRLVILNLLQQVKDPSSVLKPRTRTLPSSKLKPSATFVILVGRGAVPKW